MAESFPAMNQAHRTSAVAKAYLSNKGKGTGQKDSKEEGAKGGKEKGAKGQQRGEKRDTRRNKRTKRKGQGQRRREGDARKLGRALEKQAAWRKKWKFPGRKPLREEAGAWK